MKQQLAQITIVVDDYDRAIKHFTEDWGFELTEDTNVSETKRWVRVTPPGSTCGILLAKAANEQQLQAIGNQTGGRVFVFLHTDDFDRDFNRLTGNNIRCRELPRTEFYGKVAVLEDMYGNAWDLIEPLSF
jgi:uncharacterized glyoxalase superfamily protein PhnB